MAWNHPRQCSVAGSILLELWGLFVWLWLVSFCSLMIHLKPVARSFVSKGHLSVSTDRHPYLLDKVKLVWVVVLNKMSMPFVLT